MNNAQRKSRVEQHQHQAKNANNRKLIKAATKKMVGALKKYLMVEERNRGVYEAITQFID